jgi:hypothetical protein
LETLPLLFKMSTNLPPIMEFFLDDSWQGQS